MKGKNHFSESVVKEIELLITQKLKADTVAQKSIRAKIRKLGFYASDFGLRGGYTVLDFRMAVSSNDTVNAVKKKTEVSFNKEKTNPTKSKQNDESYIIDLCDTVFNLKGLRQHRFDFLRGDTGVKLPVDCYYPSLNLVIEYHERQHTEAVSFFDIRITSSGITRGEQRKKYDLLRQTEIPKNGIKLMIFDYSEFEYTSNKRLERNYKNDMEVIKRKLKKVKL